MLLRGENFGKKHLVRAIPGFDLSETVYPPSLSIARHDHETAALCYVLDGSYEESYGRRSAVHRAGGIVLHPAGEHHANRHGDAPATLLIVEFEDQFVERIQERLPILRENASAQGGHFSALGRRLSMEMHASDAASKLAIEGIVLETLAGAARVSAGPEKNRPLWLGRVEAYLRADTPASLAEIAKVAGVHPAHMARAFRQHMGCTIAEYSRRVRIEEACARLTGTTSLAEIAVECGFADQSHFTRTFRRIRGISPGQYRRELRDA